MSNIDPMLMRQIIMDHYDYPRNKELTDNEGYMSRHMASDSCIDDITVQTKISDGKIDDIRFDGVACTISTASTSIMSELLKGKTTEEAKEIMDNYFKMIDQKNMMKMFWMKQLRFKMLVNKRTVSIVPQLVGRLCVK